MIDHDDEYISRKDIFDLIADKVKTDPKYAKLKEIDFFTSADQMREFEFNFSKTLFLTGDPDDYSFEFIDYSEDEEVPELNYNVPSISNEVERLFHDLRKELKFEHNVNMDQEVTILNDNEGVLNVEFKFYKNDPDDVYTYIRDDEFHFANDSKDPRNKLLNLYIHILLSQCNYGQNLELYDEEDFCRFGIAFFLEAGYVYSMIEDKTDFFRLMYHKDEIRTAIFAPYFMSLLLDINEDFLYQTTEDFF